MQSCNWQVYLQNARSECGRFSFHIRAENYEIRIHKNNKFLARFSSFSFLSTRSICFLCITVDPLASEPPSNSEPKTKAMEYAHSTVTFELNPFTRLGLLIRIVKGNYLEVFLKVSTSPI